MTDDAPSTTAVLAETAVYAGTVGLIATAAVAAVVAPLGSGWTGLKTGLFVLGWVIFGVVSIRLAVGGSRGSGRSPTDQLLARVPPLRWYWTNARTMSPLVVRQLAGAVTILALSAGLEFGAGVGR